MLAFLSIKVQIYEINPFYLLLYRFYNNHPYSSKGNQPPFYSSKHFFMKVK